MSIPIRKTHKQVKNETTPASVSGGMSMEDVATYFADIPDAVLSRIKFSTPWQYDPNEGGYVDPDGFKTQATSSEKEDAKVTRDLLQKECWDKFHQNPQVNTAVRGMIGRLTGLDFSVSSKVWEIQEALEEIEFDHRNRLYNFWPKYVGRTFVEGELFLPLTVHADSFIEVDFLDPARLASNGDDSTGIIFHPDKPSMPLFYNIADENGVMIGQMPSVFIARYPELIQVASKHNDFDTKFQQKWKSRKRIYKKFGGFTSFIVAWDRGFLTRRNISYLRTTLVWLNHYENLKKYEIDHKKAAGAYLWTFSIENPRDFKTWLALSDEDKRKTGIMAKKTPGSSLVLPPGMKLDIVSPKLPTIREEDTDIMQMITSGLNEPSDITTGSARGPFASVKASRGPMSDRVSDEVAYFKRFLVHDFWSAVFFLKSSVGDFPARFRVKKATHFDEKQEPVFKKVWRMPEMLIDINFPVSEIIEFEQRARGLLGVKHGPVSETLGIPPSEVAKRLGIGNYGALRLRKAEEDDEYPELVFTIDAEAAQETAIEPSKKKQTDDQKNKKK